MLPPNAVRRWFEFSATGASTVKPPSSFATTRKPIARVIGICSCKNFSAALSMALFRRFFQQAFQLALPKRRDRVAAVAASFLAEGKHDRASFRHPLDLALEDSQLRLTDQVVRGIDREQWRADFFQARAGIVIARGLEGVEHVVRVAGLEIIGDEFVQDLIGLR